MLYSWDLRLGYELVWLEQQQELQQVLCFATVEILVFISTCDCSHSIRFILFPSRARIIPINYLPQTRIGSDEMDR